MDIAELKRLAEAAGCARWSLTVHTGADDDFDAEADDWTISHGGRQVVACEQSGIRKAEFVRYVAAANPAAVLDLIAEVERLRAELAASQAREKVRIEALEWYAKNAFDGYGNGAMAIARKALELPADDTALRAELAASQAREKVLREALENVQQSRFEIEMWVGEQKVRVIADALSIHADDTALRAALVRAQEEMRERCAEFCESSDIEYEIGRTCAVGIRALEAKP